MVYIGKNIEIGGFIARNQGTIENCFSTMNLKKTSGTLGGFTAQNTGKVSHCLSLGKMTNLSGGFMVDGSAGIEESNCFLYSDHKKKEQKIKKLKDSYLGKSMDSIKSENDLRELGFDMENVFHYQEKESIPVSFISDCWMYDVAQSARFAEYTDRMPLIISNAEEFVNFAQKVNDGDNEARNAYVILNEDIDLKGAEWNPIGTNMSTAFGGIFDGAGHTVKNFVIKDKKNDLSGLFGYLCGEIYNLTVDGKITAGKNIGGIAAVSQGGIIGCCASVVDIRLKEGAAGGLVSINSGTIFQSYSAGSIQAGVRKGKVLLPILALSLAALVYVYAMPKSEKENFEKFQKIPYDKDSVAIKEDENIEMVEGSNFVSFQFTKEVEVNATTGKCKFDFKNPGNSNQDVVIELQITDAQAKRMMGSTGRTETEQQELEKNPSYDPENYRMTLAKSGAIAPGHMLENLTLLKQPNGAVLPDGNYNAVIYLYYYDVKTNARAMVDTQLPVVIKVSR